MSSFNTYKIDPVCDVCAYLLNHGGEYDDGEDTAERHAKAMTANWGNDLKHMSVDEQGEGWRAEFCKLCDQHHVGDQWYVVVLLESKS